ncbi:MAG: hypothetical protein IKR61_04320 [Lachnospiraceae bacterium]|nr:hypothetical protein [Lachnospiraceae bacterium]
MSTIQNQVIHSLDGLSDDNLQFLLDMIQRFMKPGSVKTGSAAIGSRKIGICKPEELYAPDYDIDEDNDAIARMFGETD